MTVNAETAVGEAERRELQASIEKSTIRRASLLSMAEKFRLGAGLYDDGMRWLIQLIQAERPVWSELMVDQELEQRKAIKRRVPENGCWRPAARRAGSPNSTAGRTPPSTCCRP